MWICFMMRGAKKMSKYKVGDKVVLTVTDVNEKVYYPHYEFNNNFNLWEESIDELV